MFSVCLCVCCCVSTAVYVVGASACVSLAAGHSMVIFCWWRSLFLWESAAESAESTGPASPTGFIVFSGDTKVFILRDHKVHGLLKQIPSSDFIVLFKELHCFIAKVPSAYLAKEWDGSPAATHLFTLFPSFSKEFIKLCAASQSVWDWGLSVAYTFLLSSLSILMVIATNLTPPEAMARSYRTRFPPQLKGECQINLIGYPLQLRKKRKSPRGSEGSYDGTLITGVLCFIYGGEKTLEGVIMSSWCVEYIMSWQSRKGREKNESPSWNRDWPTRENTQSSAHTLLCITETIGERLSLRT